VIHPFGRWLKEMYHMAEGQFVALYRVSTGRQQRSGLGLDAQREAVTAFLNGGQWKLVAEFTETVSGRYSDRDRPILANAIAACRVHRARLVVSRLDRLGRDAAWLLGLERRGIDFVVASSPYINRLTIGVLALVAEEERNAISLRTRQALAARRARGLPLGNSKNLSNQQAGRATGAEANRAKALGRAHDLQTITDEIRDGGASTLREIAAALNARGIPAARGGAWSAAQVHRLISRLGNNGVIPKIEHASAAGVENNL
jgi:DNA invertase Pin-like site-specific DNA recombinase